MRRGITAREERCGDARLRMPDLLSSPGELYVENAWSAITLTRRVFVCAHIQLSTFGGIYSGVSSCRRVHIYTGNLDVCYDRQDAYQGRTDKQTRALPGLRPKCRHPPKSSTNFGT